MTLDDLDDVYVEDIHGWDYPDFCDAYISQAKHKDTGEWLTESELDKLNDDGALVYEALEAQIY